jgi:hypothetical protein
MKQSKIDELEYYNFLFKELNLGYFEIPKNASSSFRICLSKFYSNLPKYSKNIIKTYERFSSGDLPEFMATANEILSMDNIIILYRHPIDRIKSAYNNIYIGEDARNHLPKSSLNKSFSVFLKDILVQEILNYEHTSKQNIWHNHFMPQSWFIPKEVWTNKNVSYFNINDMSQVFAYLSGLTNNRFDFADNIHYNSSTYDENLHDMTDIEIWNWWNKEFPHDVSFYFKCVEAQRLKIRGHNDKTS